MTRTHSRPYVSNDNPYSEARFKTLEYGLNFPASVHGGQAADIVTQRTQVLHAALEHNPERFKKRQPTAQALPEAAWINPPPLNQVPPMSSPKPKRRALFQPLRLNLPPQVGLEGVEVFAELSRQLQQLSREGAQFSPQLQQRKQALLQRLEQGHPPTSLLRGPADVRLLLAVWREHPDSLRHTPLDAALVNLLARLLPRPSRVLLWQLTQLYLEYHTELPGQPELAAWLRRGYTQLEPRPGETAEVRAYRKHRDGLFGDDGPAALLRYTRRQRDLLPVAARAWALPETGRFYSQARQAYYLQPLAKFKPGQEHPLLEELRLEEVKTAPMPDGLLLGHHACRTLMDILLASGQDLPENWRQWLIGMMGDPRVPRSSPSFQQGWGRLERKYLNAMRIWLSKLDLRLFLDILEEVARSHDKQDLLRMFPARKRFLEGLQEQGLIRQSRLLLGRQAEKYIRDSFDQQALPEFASLGISDTSLIYLNLGNAHLLEGTHAFQARLYHLLPIPGLDDYEASQFQLAALRKYPADYTIRHAAGNLPRWQHDLIEILSLSPFNLNIEPERVLSPEDHQRYQEVWGAG